MAAQSRTHIAMLPRTARVLGYARVSSVEQGHGSSLGDQQAVIAAHAKARGLPAPRFYVETESGIHEKIERRERIRALLAEVRAGDLVVCDKIDRWSRDPEFTYRSIREILTAGASFFAIGDACDPSTPEGDTMLNFRVLFAREEHKRIKLRMVGTRTNLRNQGYFVEGLPPFGYRRSLPKGTKGPEKNILRIEEREAETVREAFRLCIQGRSMNQIAADLGLNRDRVHEALHARVYRGEIQNRAGEWIKAKHPAIVDADTFARAQAAVAGRRHGPAPGADAAETSDWILRDVARCALCGSRMGAAYAGPREARRYYYRCLAKCAARGPRANSGAYVPVRKVEAQAEPLIVARLEELREELAREPKTEPTAAASDLPERRARLQRKREKCHEMYSDAMMTRDELRAAMAKLDAQATRLDAEEDAARRPTPLAGKDARRAMLRQVRAIAEAWEEATAEEKRTIVGQLAHVVQLAAGQCCGFAWRTAEELAEASA